MQWIEGQILCLFFAFWSLFTWLVALYICSHHYAWTNSNPLSFVMWSTKDGRLLEVVDVICHHILMDISWDYCLLLLYQWSLVDMVCLMLSPGNASFVMRQLSDFCIFMICQIVFVWMWVCIVPTPLISQSHRYIYSCSFCCCMLFEELINTFEKKKGDNFKIFKKFCLKHPKKIFEGDTQYFIKN